MKIAFLDSGIGGLAYLECARAQYPQFQYLYVVDNANFPYGNKTSQEIIKITEGNIYFLREQGYRYFVFACNTASLYALEHLKVTFPDCFFCGVFPEIDLAAQISEDKSIAVIATYATMQADFLQQKQDFWEERSYRFAAQSQQDLVTQIEKRIHLDHPQKLQSHFDAIEEMVKSIKSDTLVLGCTHYAHIDALLNEILTADVKLIDSRYVMLEFMQQITPSRASNDTVSSASLMLTHNSSADRKLYKLWANDFNLNFENADSI